MHSLDESIDRSLARSFFCPSLDLWPPLLLPLPPPIDSKAKIPSLSDLLVLVATLAGSVIGGFMALAAMIEDKLNINSVYGAPVDPLDVNRNLADKVEELNNDLSDLQHQIEMAQKASGGVNLKKGGR